MEEAGQSHSKLKARQRQGLWQVAQLLETHAPKPL